ncbi:restriction endonuclease subunit S [Streptomyces sp. NPDC019224]|uniref:restriction endonuclease subunit S n=1 Tax=Streptomyces sp. NPDC019224 TaxID=3154484 RepID=UPI0033C54110
MDDSWLVLPLPEVLEFQEGPGIMARDFRESGVPLIRLAGIKRRARLLDGCDFLDPEMVARRWNHFRLQRDDVLLSTSASLGEVAQVDETGIDAIAYTGIIRFRPKDERVRPDFIRHALVAPSFKRQVEAMGVGSVIKHFGPTHLRQMTITVPPLLEQQGIAEVLGALDDKIGLNERIAETALALGRSVFRRETQVAGNETMLGDLAELVYGKALPAPLRRPGGVPVFGCTGQVGFHDTALTHSAHPVVGRKGANAGCVSWLPEPGWVIDTAFYAVPKLKEVTNQVLYFVLDAAGISTLTADSAVPGVNRGVALRHRTRAPELRRLEEMAPLAAAFLATCQQTATENRTLADLRDTLLPQLITGKIRVKDATRVVEEAV